MGSGIRFSAQNTSAHGLKLIAYQPCETQANGWPDSWHKKYYEILAIADDVICLQARYSAECMQRCNRRMIDGSSRLIAIHDGQSLGGTAQTIAYAKQQGADIVIIDPLECVCTSDPFQ